MKFNLASFLSACAALTGVSGMPVADDVELVERDANATLVRRCDGKINAYTQNSDCTGDFFEWTNLCDSGCVTNVDSNGNPTTLYSLYTYSSVNDWHIHIWTGPYCTGSIQDNFFASVGCRKEGSLSGGGPFMSYSF
ncbi:hypothetical protein QBC46DRAFT_359565 [Diplogelasinospora grovesii]|uniref:Uncharacterized protein n=1 Tax=Diplogelasinospora grovesii TaxID=303347 RepID=A0AAN6MWK5_9PEZI|nr:hypothetical protein QBC46DRAFT_359565 [Diplogelasinospora grovesii]